MSINVANWTAERTLTVGTGNITFNGAVDTTALRFSDTLPAGNVYYSILDGDNREAGIGTFDGNNTLVRTTIHASKVGTVFSSGAPITLSGQAVVSCTLNATTYNELLHRTLGDINGVTITTPSNNQVLTFDGTGWINQAPLSEAGVVKELITQTAHGYATGNALYLNSSGVWTLAQADAEISIATQLCEVVDANDFYIVQLGDVSGLTGLVVGDWYYCSTATAGAITNSRPTVGIENPIGFAQSTTVLHVEFIRASEVSDLGTVGSIKHGDLSDLTLDQHTQYALADGTRGDFAATVHTHTGTYEPANVNIQAHIADGTLHFTQAAISITESQISDLQTYILNTEKASANGVATLGVDSKIPSSQIPALAITDTFVVASEAAMLLLVAQTGDVAVRTDENKSYILQGADASVLGDWQVLLTPTDSVLSVNSQTGAVVLTTTDISEGTNLYYTETRVSANTDVAANIAHTANTANPHSTSVVNLTDTTLTTPASDEVLLYDGTKWINSTPLNVSSDNINMPVIGTPTYNTLTEHSAVVSSTGLITGGTITDAGAGAIDVAAVTGYIRATSTDTVPIYAFDVAAVTALVLIDQAINFIYVEYNAGTPQIVTTNVERTDHETNILLGNVHRDGTTVHINTYRNDLIISGMGHALERFNALAPMAYESGALISETGTLNLAVTVGNFWEGLTKITTGSIDTSVADTFEYFYQDGAGGWTLVPAVTQIDNLQYDDGTGTLATLGNSRYGVHWVYAAVDGAIILVYGTGSYVAADAELAQPGLVPPHIPVHATLAGKIIVQKSSVTFYSIESAFDTSFTAQGISSHLNLTDIGINTHDQIDAHIASVSNPHVVTQTQVGLGNVDNTSDVNKPISTLTQTALDTKIGAADYATSTVGGTIKIRVTGTDAFITTSGTNP